MMDTAPYYIWLFGTTILVALFVGMTVQTLCFAWLKRTAGSVFLVSLSIALLFLSAIANPALNCLILCPLFEPKVDVMYGALKAEAYTGRAKSELVSRFGEPDEVTRTPKGESLRYDCRPWFALAWTEVVVHVQDDHIKGFYRDD